MAGPGTQAGWAITNAGSVHSFRDLDAWKVAMELTVVVYNTAKLLPQSERYELSSQIRRAAVSVPSNIAEGQSSGADGRYIYHPRIALGSLGELATDIELAVRLGFITASAGENVEKQLIRTSQVVFGLLRSRRRKRLGRAINGVALLALGCWILRLAALLDHCLKQRSRAPTVPSFLRSRDPAIPRFTNRATQSRDLLASRGGRAGSRRAGPQQRARMARR
jgi:four helix bundle protein